MKDPISEGLNFLTLGLRPYVAFRIDAVFHNSELAAQVGSWDAQALLVFMWERWNELFRSELSFVERSLISELRDFRNRWAHQDGLKERDIYRVLDNIERMLIAIDSSQVRPVTLLRRESLNRLWSSELGDDEKQRRLRVLWPYLLCGSCGLALSTAIISFGPAPWSWILSVLVMLGFIRLAWAQSTRESQIGPGPHECRDCGRIIYTIVCPYCSHAKSENSESSRVSVGERLPEARTELRLPPNTPPSRMESTIATAASPTQKV
jgi:hypothetical protein